MSLQISNLKTIKGETNLHKHYNSQLYAPYPYKVNGITMEIPKVKGDLKINSITKM